MREFDSVGFLNYMKDKYPESGSDILFTLIDNLVDYAFERKNHSLDQMVNFLADMIPETEFGEIAQFMPDCYLTRCGRGEKREWLEQYGEICFDQNIETENMNKATLHVMGALHSALAIYDPVELRVSIDEVDCIQVEVLERGEYMTRIEYAPDCDLEWLKRVIERLGVECDF